MQITVGTRVEEKITSEKIIEAILAQRNIPDIQAFLTPPHPLSFSLKMLGFEKEFATLLKHLTDCKKNSQQIVVYTDYDADGITGGTVLWETLHELGFAAFPYVPHRQTEGYGFSLQGIDAIIEKYHPGLIISVDHGISAREQIQYAADKGIPVVVTDHHTKPTHLPDAAVALIHCPLVSGSGLAYITALDIWRAFDATNESLEYLFTYDFLALASLGTVADLVPLIGYSRSIVKYGLEAFSHVQKPGIKELLAVSGLTSTKISAYHVGFALAPRINAVGRLSHAIEAVRMLCTKDVGKAKRLASEAQNHNLTRQKMVDVAVEEAFIEIEKKEIPRLILQKKIGWNEGIIGLIASKIAERYRRPTIVMTKTDTGWKGSARSVKGFDITTYLRSFELLKHVGGHPQAAGFSFEDAELARFEKKIDDSQEKIPLSLEKELFVDLSLPLQSVSEKLADALVQLAPFGIGNPTPVFQSRGKVLFAKSMGKKMEHIKFVVQDLEDLTKQLECIYFSPSLDQKERVREGDVITINVTIETQYWQGKKRLQGIVKSIS